MKGSRFFVPIVAIAIVVLVSACSGAATTASTAAKSAPAASTSAPAAGVSTPAASTNSSPASTSVPGAGGSAPAATGPAKTLRLAHGQTTTDPLDQGVLAMAKDLEQRSGGSLKIQDFPNNQLGQVAATVQGTQSGSIDLVVTGNSYYSGIVPDTQVLELPFLFKDYNTAHAALDGPVGNALAAKFDGTGLKLLGWWELGFRDLTNSKHPVKSPADLSGLKIRTLPSPIQLALWKDLGAQPTPIDFSELYLALSQGTVDAQENPVTIILSSKFYEVQKYLTLTHHVYSAAPLLVSQQTWNALSDSQRTALQAAAKAGTDYERKLVESGSDDALNQLKQHGMQVVSDPDIAAFRDKAQPVYQDFRQKYGGTYLDQLLK